MGVPGNTRIYGAAGASIIAAAVTARYVAKWRRRRSLRRGGGDRGVGGGQVFIGLDLSDPTAERPRPCDYAVLDTDFSCTFGQWDYREDGTRIIPDAALGRSFILGIDGPQGLAGDPGSDVRYSEKAVNAPGRSPYEFPTDGKPYEGLITGSVRLFYQLVLSSRFRLLGLDGITPADTTLLEVYPGGAWKIVAEEPLPPKKTLDGRHARTELLANLGLQLPSVALPTADQLDAAIAAWVAYKFWAGEAKLEGRAPEIDQQAGVIREGYVVQPNRMDESSSEIDVAPV